MTAKNKPNATANKSARLQIEAEADDSRDRLIAKAAAGPHLGAAGVITNFGRSIWGEISLTDLVHVLKAQTDGLSGGDLRHAEAMLCAQATSLNMMFAELARRAAVNMGEYLDATETYLKLALRAQSQCRATLETLATIKNPPVVFAKQANIAHGPQQVNNDTASIARASETEKAPNELLEADDHGQGLDTGATRPAGAGHQELATVEAVDRPAHGGRKNAIKR